MGGAPTSKPERPRSLLDLPQPGDEHPPNFKMTRGNAQPGWEVKNQRGLLWMWLDDSGKLEDFDGNAVGTYSEDPEPVLKICRKIEWTHGEDSDSSEASDDSGHGDSTHLKLRWKAVRKTKFEDHDAGASEGDRYIRMMIKGKSRVNVERDDDTKQYKAGEIDQTTTKARYTLQWNSEKTDWEVMAGSEVNIPQAFSFDRQDRMCRRGIKIFVTPADDCIIEPKMVPLVAGACHDKVEQTRIEHEIDIMCREQGRRLAHEMNHLPMTEMSDSTPRVEEATAPQSG